MHIIIKKQKNNFIGILKGFLFLFLRAFVGFTSGPENNVPQQVMKGIFLYFELI